MREYSNEKLLEEIRKTGDSDGVLTWQLWEQNRGLVLKAVNKFKGYLEKEDAKQECYFAFTAAISDYNPDGGANFATYLHSRCVWHLQRYLENCGYCVRIPSYQRQAIKQYKRMITQYYQEKGTMPEDSAICKNLNITLYQLEQLRKDIYAADTVKSLSVPIYDEDDPEAIIDVIPDTNADTERDALDDHYKEERARAVWKVVDTLETKSGEAVRLYYRDGLTYTEIGRAMGISGERVRTILAGGLRNLRQGKRYRVLREFIDLSPEYSAGLRGGLNSFRASWTSSTEKTAIMAVMDERGQGEQYRQLQGQIEALKAKLEKDGNINRA